MKSALFAGLIAIAAISATAIAAPKPPAGHYTGDKLARKAKVTVEQAEAVALKARPGEVTDKELEKEKGGSGLRYSFDIKADGVTYEVGVDAKTGEVLENAAEGKNPD